MKHYFLIFITAFVLNAVWEHAHSFLYLHHKSGIITEYILFRAAIFDGAIITLFAFIFLSVLNYKYRLWIMAAGLFIFAVGLELWALETSRWMYADAMPVIPFLNTGLTPTIQLSLLGYLSVLIVQRFKNFAPPTR